MNTDISEYYQENRDRTKQTQRTAFVVSFIRANISNSPYKYSCLSIAKSLCSFIDIKYITITAPNRTYSIPASILPPDIKEAKVSSGLAVEIIVKFYSKFGADAKDIAQGRLERPDSFKRIAGEKYANFIDGYFEELYDIKRPEVCESWESPRESGIYDQYYPEIIKNATVILNYRDMINSISDLGARVLANLCCLAFAKNLIHKSFNSTRMLRTTAPTPKQIIDPAYGPLTWDERDRLLV